MSGGARVLHPPSPVRLGSELVGARSSMRRAQHGHPHRAARESGGGCSLKRSAPSASMRYEQLGGHSTWCTQELARARIHARRNGPWIRASTWDTQSPAAWRGHTVCQAQAQAQAPRLCLALRRKADECLFQPLSSEATSDRGRPTCYMAEGVQGHAIARA